MSRTVFVLKVYVIVKKQKKKNIRPHPHMDPNKMPGVYGGTAEYQKNYYIYKNQIKNIKIKIINIKAVYQRPTRNKLPPRTSRKHRLPNC